MGVYGYDWEPFKITTEDGYVLTLMHITNRTGQKSSVDPNLNPILYVPAMGSNPDTWLSAGIYTDPPQNAIQLKILDAGHDTWMLYSRGCHYSLEHEKYTTDDPQFWNFSWYEMGYFDLKATVDFIYKRTNQRVAMMGYSMGTTQIFAAVAAEYDFFRSRVHKVVQQAPCVLTDVSMYAGFNTVTVNAIKATGITSIGGPDWYLTQGKMRNIMGLKLMQKFLLGGWGTRLINVSMKSFDHYSQCAKEDRFQMYSKSYYTPVVGKKRTELIDLSVITAETPFGFFMGELDTTCPSK